MNDRDTAALDQMAEDLVSGLCERERVHMIVKVPRKLLADAANELSEMVRSDGGCDHSVNICWCSVIGLVRQLREAACTGHEWYPVYPGEKRCLWCPAIRLVEVTPTSEFEE